MLELHEEFTTLAESQFALREGVPSSLARQMLGDPMKAYLYVLEIPEVGYFNYQVGWMPATLAEQESLLRTLRMVVSKQARHDGLDLSGGVYG